MLPPPSGAESKPSDSKKSGDSKKDEPPKVEGPKTEIPKSSAGTAKLTADEVTAIKELPAQEQQQALQQAVCPVSGDHLGGMGKPFKIAAAGRTFFLCCDSCEEKVKANPQAVIAKLDKK